MAATKDRKAVRVRHCTSLADAAARGREIQALVYQLREGGHARGIEQTIKTAGEVDAAGMRNLRKLVARVIEGKEPPPWDRPLVVEGETFEAFAMKWVKGELAELYPDHVERKRSAYTDLCYLQRYIFPVVGGKPIVAVTLEDYEQVAHDARKRRSAPARLDNVAS